MATVSTVRAARVAINVMAFICLCAISLSLGSHFHPLLEERPFVSVSCPNGSVYFARRSVSGPRGPRIAQRLQSSRGHLEQIDRSKTAGLLLLHFQLGGGLPGVSVGARPPAKVSHNRVLPRPHLFILWWQPARLVRLVNLSVYFARANGAQN